eukprot:TRINITY_DN73531_c0_g1_i1.p1 TRINITY_DN73531_c0_g1~~TRINITY_DN73531_c0_g1_i1.p1  ORF type:complete len:274 (-),score=46.87 TRINITY_DN73531_c0_g1_i1:60-881(-)
MARSVLGPTRQNSKSIVAFVMFSALSCSFLAAYLLYLQIQGSHPFNPLNGTELYDFLKANDNGALVYFYLPNCSHCEQLALELEQAVHQTQELEGESAVAFGSVNADAEPEAARRFGLSQYPAVLWIRNGEIVNELEPTSRSVDKIIDFIHLVQQPAVIDFETHAEFEEAVPKFRETLQHRKSAVFAGFAGFSDVYDALNHAAHVFRGKAVFIYVREVGETDGVALRSITHSAESDDAYTQMPVQRESVKMWVERVMRGLKQEASLVAEKEET